MVSGQFFSDCIKTLLNSSLPRNDIMYNISGMMGKGECKGEGRRCKSVLIPLVVTGEKLNLI